MISLPLKNQWRLMLAVRLGDVEALHGGGISPDPVHEEIRVVVQVPLVEGQAQLPVHPSRARPAPPPEPGIVEALGSGSTPVSKVLEGLRVDALRHPIVDQGRNAAWSLLAERLVACSR